MSKHLRPTRTFREQIPAQQPPEPLGEPQLIWPSIKYGQHIENHDVSRFPDRHFISERYKEGQRRGVLKLLAFERAVREAEVHILVLDLHFDEKGVDVLDPALERSQVLDVRLLTGRGKVDEKERARLRRKLTDCINRNRVGARRVEVQ